MKRGFYFMKKDVILEEIKKELNWREKFIAKLFKKYTYRICGIAEKRVINNILNQ